MNCKNCGANLRTDFRYCPNCGAKVVLKRITFKGLFMDIFERMLNLENNFFKTVGHLTIWPEKVIAGYIDGTRRKYLNPLNYLTISLFLSGIILYCLRKFALDKMDFDVFGINANTEGTMKVMNFVLEYNNFIFLFYIPVIALSGWLTFNQRSHNLPEYIVTGTYVLAHTSVLTFPITLFVILGYPETYMIYSFFSLFFMLIYSLFVLLRIHRFPIGMTIIRVFLFSILFLIGYFGLSIVINVFLVLIGYIEFEEFLPPAA